MSTIDDYYAQKEVIYSVQVKCAQLYTVKCNAETEWQNACQELYAAERKANELSEEIFKQGKEQ